MATTTSFHKPKSITAKSLDSTCITLSFKDRHDNTVVVFLDHCDVRPLLDAALRAECIVAGAK